MCYVTLWLSFTMRRLRHRCFKNKRTSHVNNIEPQFVEEGECHPPDYGMHNIIYRERMDGWMEIERVLHRNKNRLVHRTIAVYV